MALRVVAVTYAPNSSGYDQLGFDTNLYRLDQDLPPTSSPGCLFLLYDSVALELSK